MEDNAPQHPCKRSVHPTRKKHPQQLVAPAEYAIIVATRANRSAKPNTLAASTGQPRKRVHHHFILWKTTPNQHCHLSFIMHPSFIEQCRLPQSHHAAEANVGTGTDHRCSFAHNSSHTTARQNRQHQKTPVVLTRYLHGVGILSASVQRHSPLLEDRLPCTVSR